MLSSNQGSPHNPMGIFEVGQTAGPERVPVGEVVYRPLPIGLATTLESMNKDYAFFTTGLLHFFAGVNQQPWADFAEETRQHVIFYHHQFNKPLFSGIANRVNSNWNHVLMALHREQAEKFFDFMTSLLFYCSQTDRLLRVGRQQLTIRDPLQSDTSVLLPAVPAALDILVFGILNDEISIYLHPEPVLSPIVPYVKSGSPLPEIVVYSEALRAGQNPHRAVEDYLARQKEKEV